MSTHAAPNDSLDTDPDVVVVGAGFSGLYLLYRLRGLGFSTVVIESAADVGGTWYWNRYPGARCDIESIDYSYSFDLDLEREWQWSERYATQPEILRYLGHVADKHDLRRDIRFSTRVVSGAWDADIARWRVRTEAGDELRCRFWVMATGCLSLPKAPDIEGVERFRGDTYFTSRWPHGGVDFSGKRVAVIGTGSSGIQVIPSIAEQAAELAVFQRTANFSRPAFNGPVAPEKQSVFETDRVAYREAARWSRVGVPAAAPRERTFEVSDAERLARYEEAYASGDLIAMGFAFVDTISDAQANETACEFLRGKIRAIVRDPETAESLCPTNHFYGTKRPCLDTGYYEAFNLPHVRLVDLRKEPIRAVTDRGIDTASRTFEFDAIVFATGFDAMTGPIVAVDIRGRAGLGLAEKWLEGPKTYLGLMTAGFPNLFMITGPGSPSVLSNMVVSIEQHVDWVGACLAHMRAERLAVIEPTPTAEAGWVQHVNDAADITLFPRADSWYMGANVPGKPRVFLPYLGGVDRYRRTCDEIVDRGYLGFAFDGPGGVRCNDGVVNRLQVDVAIVLELIESLGLPPLETLSVRDARAQIAAMAEGRPPGPEVGSVTDGVLTGEAGPLAYRCYRPARPGPHPVVVYFHGGGWVFGGPTSDEPFCRDLCVPDAADRVRSRTRVGTVRPAPADGAREVVGVRGPGPPRTSYRFRIATYGVPSRTASEGQRKSHGSTDRLLSDLRLDCPEGSEFRCADPRGDGSSRPARERPAGSVRDRRCRSDRRFPEGRPVGKAPPQALAQRRRGLDRRARRRAGGRATLSFLRGGELAIGNDREVARVVSHASLH